MQAQLGYTEGDLVASMDLNLAYTMVHLPMLKVNIKNIITGSIWIGVLHVVASPI